MDDLPYTTPEEDPFHVQPPARLSQPPCSPSSLLDKWIKEQKEQQEQLPAEFQLPPPPTVESPRCGTPTHPFLAYPDLGRLSLEQAQKPPEDDVSTVYSYDLVDDDDIPNATITAPELQPPTTPIGPRSNKSPKALLTPSTFRNLNLSFRPSSQSTSTHDSTPSPRTSSRMSIFTRASRQSTSTLTSINTSSHHARSSSLSTINTTTLPAESPTVKAPSSASRWRPSILGHFPQASSSGSSMIPFDSSYTPPRPSLSSGDTYVSGNSASRTETTLDSELPPTPSKPSFFESIRSRNRSSLSIFRPPNSVASSSSIWSQPYSSRGRLEEAAADPNQPADCFSAGGDSTLPRRAPFAPKSSNQYDNLLDEEDSLENYVPPPPKRESARGSINLAPSSTFSRVTFGSLNSRNQKKKKKLVISGVGVHEMRKFEGVKRWCESFGEVRQITRAPNGDLHIDFRQADVADTVCRVRAKVFIAGVGSVYLSWLAGDKR